MFGRKKLKLLIYSVIISLNLGCSSNNASTLEGFEMSGETQGTTYTIIVAEEKLYFSQDDIENLLKEFDDVLSTYLPKSKISLLNAEPSDYSFLDKKGFFKTCYETSRTVFQESDGVFDPSVFPIIEGWGFFKHIETPLSASKIDSILTFVSFEEHKLHKVSFSRDSVYFKKYDKRFKLDFNAIAQGQSIDILTDFIASKGHKNFYVEIGGEIRVKGKNREGKKWRIGIDTPAELNSGANERVISGILNLENQSVATSGNYRNFYEKNGKKYAHILNPKTGIPVDHNLLSATVIADNCAIADAYATVFMVLGLEKSKELLKKSSRNLEVVFIFEDVHGKMSVFSSDGLKGILE